MSVSNRSRGGYAPRRGRGGWADARYKRQGPVQPDLNKHPLGKLIRTIQPCDLVPLQADLLSPPQIRGCQYVTSYNWITGEDSSISIPGQPPRWTPLKVPRRLSEDSGIYYRDPNAARYPEYPIAPAVQAILSTTGEAPFDADVFACGSTLGNLLRFIRGTDKAFRFTAELIGKTVFLIRKENDPKELIEGVRGFGHAFPEAYTTWPKEVKGSETHQRIIQYNLGRLQCLLRYECDGFFDDPSHTNRPDPASSVHETSTPLSADALLETLSTTSISTPNPSSTASTTTLPLTIHLTGSPTPQHSIFDLKTRSGKHGQDIRMDDITPLLYLKQIPSFIVAYHDGHGLFPAHNIHIQDVRPLTAAFETRNAGAIRGLTVLLRQIIDAVFAEEDGVLEVYSDGKGAVELRCPFGREGEALPSVLREQWVGRCGGGGGLGVEVETGGDAVAGAAMDDAGKGVLDLSWDEEEDESDKDFTACGEECGYCGRCTY